MDSIWYVYILESSKLPRLYTGISPDPKRRLGEHNSGNGAKATRAGRPWSIVYLEKLLDKSSALKREYAIKQLSRVQKLTLIRDSA